MVSEQEARRARAADGSVPPRNVPRLYTCVIVRCMSKLEHAFVHGKMVVVVVYGRRRRRQRRRRRTGKIGAHVLAIRQRTGRTHLSKDGDRGACVEAERDAKHLLLAGLREGEGVIQALVCAE